MHIDDESAEVTAPWRPDLEHVLDAGPPSIRLTSLNFLSTHHTIAHIRVSIMVMKCHEAKNN